MRYAALALVLAISACGGGSTPIADARPDSTGADGQIGDDGGAPDASTADAPTTDAPTTDAADVDATTSVDAADVDATTSGDAADVDAPPTIDAPVTAIDAAATVDATATVDAAAGVPDPAPGLDTPGEYTGAGCPDSNQTLFTLNVGAASAYTFSGTITGATGDGVFWVHGPAGETVGGPVETSPTGTYAKTLPMFCGANTVKLVWTNGTCPLVLVYAVNRTSCEPADITATVQWDDLGRDWELHLIKPGGHINDDATDCTWTSCIGTSPDWGVPGDATDNPHKDIDNTSAYGPENIWLANPEPGTYTVMVEHWNPGGNPLSDGFVTLNVAGHVVTVAITDLAPLHVWTAATIDWPSGTVTTTTAIHDCTANWSSGCRDLIP